MRSDLDSILSAVRDDVPPAVSGIENGIWPEIRRRRYAQHRMLGEIGRNTSIAAVALLIGMAVGFGRSLPPHHTVNIALLLTEVPPASLLE